MSLIRYNPASFGNKREPKPIYDTIKYGMLYNDLLLEEFKANLNLIISDEMLLEGWGFPTLANYDIDLIDYLCTILSTDTDNIGKYVRLNRVYPQEHPRWNYHEELSNNITKFNWLPCGEFAIKMGFPVQGSSCGTAGTMVVLRNLQTPIRRFRLELFGGNQYEKNFIDNSDILFGGIRLIRNATIQEQQLPNFINLQPYVGSTGIKYPTVKINNHVWVAWNLADRKYINGNWLPGGNELLPTEEFKILDIPYCTPPILEEQQFTDENRWLNVI